VVDDWRAVFLASSDENDDSDEDEDGEEDEDKEDETSTDEDDDDDDGDDDDDDVLSLSRIFPERMHWSKRLAYRRQTTNFSSRRRR